jgi:hypothetical protein
MAVKKTTPKDRAAARSKMKQGDQAKSSAARAARPGKVSEAGMANIPASIARLGKVAIDAYKRGTQAATKSKPKVNPNGTTPANSPYSAQAFAKRAAAQKAEKEKLAREAASAKRSKATESAGLKNRYENTQKAKALREEAARKTEAARIKRNTAAKKSTNASNISGPNRVPR